MRPRPRISHRGDDDSQHDATFLAAGFDAHPVPDGLGARKYDGPRQHQRGRDAPPYPGARLRRIRGPRPRLQGRGFDGRLHHRPIPPRRPQAGNPNGTYIQEVPLVGFKTKAKGQFEIGGKAIPLDFPRDWVAVSRRETPSVQVENSDVVFVGYGVVAPEYGWDDYKDVDVKGKTIVMLVNDPAVPDPKDPSKLDDAMFKGKAMTYYGRWTYKYEIATAKGAAAAILIHETGPAGYPYQVVVGSWGRENFDLISQGRQQVDAPPSKPGCRWRRPRPSSPPPVRISTP